MKRKSILVLVAALSLGFASQAQNTDSLHLNFCDAVKYLLKDCIATHFKSIKGKDIGYVAYESKLKLEGFSDEQISTLGTFDAIYLKKATSADEVNLLVDELNRQVSQCTGFTPFISKEKGLKNSLLEDDKASGLKSKVMIFAEKVSKREYIVKLMVNVGR